MEKERITKIHDTIDADDVIETETLNGVNSIAEVDDGSAKENINGAENTKIMTASKCTKDLISSKEPVASSTKAITRLYSTNESQSSIRLFSLLPPEIRLIIWNLALHPQSEKEKQSVLMVTAHVRRHNETLELYFELYYNYRTESSSLDQFGKITRRKAKPIPLFSVCKESRTMAMRDYPDTRPSRQTSLIRFNSNSDIVLIVNLNYLIEFLDAEAAQDSSSKLGVFRGNQTAFGFWTLLASGSITIILSLNRSKYFPISRSGLYAFTWSMVSIM